GRREVLPFGAGRAHRRRARLPGLRGRLLVRLLRAQGHAAGRDRRIEQGRQRGAARAGSADGQGRRRPGGRHTGAVRPLRAQGVREVEGHRAGVEGDRGVSPPLRILLSRAAGERLAGEIAVALGGRPHGLVEPERGIDADLAFVSRDVTGLSTKFALPPATQAFHDAMEGAPSLRWVHIHSAGVDRPVYQRLRARGVQVSTSSGANATVVAHSALAGVLALARHLPLLWAAQREHTWAPLMASGLPRDL